MQDLTILYKNKRLEWGYGIFSRGTENFQGGTDFFWGVRIVSKWGWQYSAAVWVSSL